MSKKNSQKKAFMNFFRLFLFLIVFLSFSHGFCSDDIKKIALSVGGILVSTTGIYGVTKIVESRRKLDDLLRIYKDRLLNDNSWGAQNKRLKISCLANFSSAYHNHGVTPSFLTNCTFGRTCKNVYNNFFKNNVMQWGKLNAGNVRTKIINEDKITDEELEKIRNNFIKDIENSKYIIPKNLFVPRIILLLGILSLGYNFWHFFKRVRAVYVKK